VPSSTPEAADDDTDRIAPKAPAATASSPVRMTIRTPGLPLTRRPTGPAATSLWLPSVGYSSLADVARTATPMQTSGPTPSTATPPRAAHPTPGSNVTLSPNAAPAEIIVGRAPPQVVTITGGSASQTASQPPRPAAADQTGQVPVRVGLYEVATRVARGGMGSVYVCRKAGGADNGRLLTLKVVRQHTIKHELAAESFRHEARIGALFRHPNAHTVIDSGVDEGQPFLILDYIDGGSLADLLVEDTRPSPAIAVAIVLDVLAALHALHETMDAAGKPLGLVHCDVSPENVLVGVNGVARLADFGSARFTAVSNEAQPFAVSKPPCMPPEQFRGDKLDSRSDLYSVGVLLWTALTGQQPFAADDYDKTVINVMRKKIKPPSAYGAPACLDDVCMQALSRSPDGRFVVAGAMAAALRTTATAHNLVESREGVGDWVRRAMGDELAHRHRLVDGMFGGDRGMVTVGGGAAPVEARGSGSRAPGRPTPISTKPVGTKSTPTPPRGERVLGDRPMFAPATLVRLRLTDLQKTIIALASVFAFAATITTGLALSRKPSASANRPRLRPPATAQAPAPGTLPASGTPPSLLAPLAPKAAATQGVP
jgi:eukaryotic-like serine/threonine-protein kinase